MIEVWYDGACGPNNPGGHTGCGILIKEDSNILYQESYYHGFGTGMSNNVAEYLGIIRSLTYLIENNKTEDVVLCYGDSQLTIMQMTGQWKSKKGSYIPYYLKAIDLAYKFKDISFRWICRELNTDADELSKIAISTHLTQVFYPVLKT